MPASYFDVDGTLVRTNLLHPTLFYLLNQQTPLRSLGKLARAAFRAPRLAIAELQYAYPSLGTMLYADQPEPLARTYRLGFWYDDGKFADQEIGQDGLSLANPASNGLPRLHQGNYSIYAVADQLIWRERPDTEEGVGVFFRAMAAPACARTADSRLMLAARSALLSMIFSSAEVARAARRPELSRSSDSMKG